MNLLTKLALVIASLALLTSCYERKVVKLDYSERLKEKYYTPTGLPGEAHVGRTGTEDKYHGMHGEHAVKKPEAKPEEKKVEEKAPAELEEKAEEPKAEEKTEEKAEEKTEEKATEGDTGKEKSLEDAFKG